MPIDDDGLIPEALRRRSPADPRRPRVKFLYTIPTYQNPTGVTLTDERRERVLDIWRARRLLVVEDDRTVSWVSRGCPSPLRARRRDGVFYPAPSPRPSRRSAGRLDPRPARGPRASGHRQRGADPLPSGFAQAAVST